MDKEWNDVKEFHRVFGHPIGSTPTKLNAEETEFRANLMLEELNEFRNAEDLADQADAMIDLSYFLLGTLVMMGVTPDRLFNIVHEANMTKVWPDGTIKYREDGKVLKPSNWKDPKNRILNELYRQYVEQNPLP